MTRSRTESARTERIVIDVLEHPDLKETLSDMRLGLLRTPREISSKFFYDDRGMAIAGVGVAGEDLDGDGDTDLLVTNIQH